MSSARLTLAAFAIVSVCSKRHREYTGESRERLYYSTEGVEDDGVEDECVVVVALLVLVKLVPL